MAKQAESQSEKFKKAARELGCEENEEAVDRLMKQVAKAPPPRKAEKAESSTKKKNVRK